MKKRKYVHIQAIESKLLEMRTEGKSRREMAKELGLSLKQIENWINRRNRKQRKIERGEAIHPQDRPRNRPMTKEEEYQRRIAQLEMENKLLRDFLQSTERK